MLNLVKYEWKAKGKKGLLLGMVFLVLAIMALVLRQKNISYADDTVIDIESIHCFINTPGGLIFSLTMLLALALFVYVVILLQAVMSIIWDEQKMKGGYLLLTTPEPVAKILAAKLLAIFPLVLILAVINPMFHLGELVWWVQVLIFYAVIMLVVFVSMLKKAALLGKWYAEHLLTIVFFASAVAGLATEVFFDFFDVETLGGLSYFTILFLIGMSVALFFASAYLLENKLDVWE